MSTLRLRYQTIEFGDTDIHVRTLRDRQQVSDAEEVELVVGISPANWALFGVIWASGELLARIMFEYEVEGKRILEVGCGIGLASLVLNYRHADITATDHHPEVEGFLLENTKLNGLQTIPFVRTGWSDAETNLGLFDIIIGSDLLYEQGHPEELSRFIDQHAKPNCHVMIIDPGRKHSARFSKHMTVLGFSFDRSTPEHIEDITQPFRGVNQFQLLSFVR